ncbi:MAG TPA: hypothetical protein VGE74_17750 [Gemmata sp.]
MFFPVGCANCGKPFQVPETALGKSVECPWCQSAVPALPVAKVVEPAPAPAPVPPPAVVEPPPGHKSPAPKWLKKYTTERPKVPARSVLVVKPLDAQPLSLDDELTEPFYPPAPPAPKKRGPFRPVPILVGLTVSFVVMGLTVVVLGYGSGRAQESRWAEFTPPDKSCSVLLPAPPREEPTEPNPAGSVADGKRFVATSWYTRATAWLAWNDLDPTFAEAVAKDKDKDKAFTASAIRAELEREKKRLQGTVTKEMELRLNTAWGIEVHMDTPHGKVIEWLLVAADEPNPRLYVYGLRATNITPESAVVRRMFTSFKLSP